MSVCFPGGWLKHFKSRFLVVSGRSKASGTWVPRGPPSLPSSTCTLIPQPLKWRKKEEMWAGPLVGGDGKNRGKDELELGRKRFFPLDPAFLFVKLVCVASVFSAGLGGKSSCLALECSWAMPFHQPDSWVQSAGGTHRTRSKIMLGLSTSCPGKN